MIRSEPGADAGVFYRRVTTQSVLDRYLSRSQIDPRQFDVGTKLYRMWRAAGGEQERDAGPFQGAGPGVDGVQRLELAARIAQR